MKKKLFPVGMLMLLLLTCVLFRPQLTHAEEPEVSLTIYGVSAGNKVLQDQQYTIVIRAPGATAVRLWDPDENRWEYFDRDDSLNYLELRWSYDIYNATGTHKSVYAEARYDEYEDSSVLWEQEADRYWPGKSNTINLTVDISNGELDPPVAGLDKTSVVRGEWVTARVTPQDHGEWYWADIVPMDENEDEGDHYDSNFTDVISIPTACYEPGDYWLFVYNAAPGYEHGVKRLPFTITNAADEEDYTGLFVSTEEAPIWTDVMFSAYVPEADHLEITMYRQDDGERWNHWNWGNESGWGYWSPNRSGVFDCELIAWKDGEEIHNETVSVEFVPAVEGDDDPWLSAPDLTDFSALLENETDFTGTVGVDPRARWMEFYIEYRPSDNGDEWVTIYKANRSSYDGSGWTTFTLPASLFEAEGRYVIYADVTTPGYEGNYSEYSFFRFDNASDDITITLNGETGTIPTVTNQDYTLLVRAPGATAVRVWDSDRNDYEYFDRNNRLNYLEIRRNCSKGYYSIYAQARYDEYPEEDYDIGEDDDSVWTATSNVLVLDTTAPNGQLEAPHAELNKNTFARGEWLTASITHTLDQSEWYWADVERIRYDEEENEWLDHYDFNNSTELSIPTALYEPGDYNLIVHDAASGYMENEVYLPFTVTEHDIPEGLMVSTETSLVSVDVVLFAYVPGADYLDLNMTRQDDPGWRDNRWSGGEMGWHYWNSDLSGTYTVTLTAWQGDEVIPVENDSATIEFISNGYLQKADLSGFPAILQAGQNFAGTIGVDDLADRIDVNIDYRSDDGEEYGIYWNDFHVADGDNWTTLDLPAELFTEEGAYHLHVSSHAAGFESSHTEFTFLRTDSVSNDLSLKVNGSDADVIEVDSSTDFTVSVTTSSTDVTAVRILRDDGWWDYEDLQNGRVMRDYSFNAGTYTFAAQATTAEPVWREDDFDWGSFEWKDLEWTDFSNAVKVHVVSPKGTLDKPQVTMLPGAQVERGEWIDIEAEPQNQGEWIWADLREKTFNEDDPDDWWWDDIDHFDSHRDLSLRIPSLFLEPGDYQLEVWTGAVGYENNSTILYFEVLESQDLPEAALLLSRDTMQTSENLTFYAYAPGASHMRVDIYWDRDPYWKNWYDTGNDFDSWDWGCGSGGNYTFELSAWYPEESGKEPVTVTEQLTVTSEGQLDRPDLSDIPSIMYVGDEIHSNFQNIEKAGWYDIDLYYSEDGNWQELYHQHRDPSMDGATDLDFSSEMFMLPGRYELHVNASAVGIDNGYSERYILVLSNEEPSEDLVISLAGSEPEADIYLYQPVDLSVSRPDDITALRIWSGESWSVWFMPNDSSIFSIDTDREGPLTLVAQASTDQSVADWDEEHDGDFSDFDFGQINWSMTSNVLELDVICYGDLAAPVVHMPEGNTVERGEWLEFSFDEVANAAVYGARIWRAGSEPRESNMFDNEVLSDRTIRVSTIDMEPGDYLLSIDSRRYGWRGKETICPFTVVQTESWGDEPIFMISKTEVLACEQVPVSVYVPGAEEVILCHENLENRWRVGQDTITGTIMCNREGNYRLYVYARYPESDDWVQIGDPITVTATAPYGTLEGILDAPTVVSTEEDFSYSFTLRHHGNEPGYMDFGLFRNDENVLWYLDRNNFSFEINEGDEEDTVTYSFAAGALEPGVYRIHCWVMPPMEGYNVTEINQDLIVTDDPNEKIFTNIRSEYVSQDLVHTVIRAPGAEQIYMWISDVSPVDETASEPLQSRERRDTLEQDIVFGRRAGTVYVKIKAEYENGDVETKEMEVQIVAPNGDLPDARIWMDDAWTEGQDLNFRVEAPAGATFIWTWIHDPDAAEDVDVGGDEEPRFDDSDWNYSFPAELFVPGKWYELKVFSSEVGYNCNEVVYNICMLPGNAGTMVLPAALTEIETEAFAGIAAQKLVIPDTISYAEYRAFADCEDLIVVELPNSCDGLDLNAFEGSGPLMTYGYPNTSAEEYSHNTGISFIYLND